MASLAEFLERLFAEGRVAFEGPPGAIGGRAERDGAVDVLRRAYREDLMDLAGPPIGLDEPTALAASEWTRLACWFLVGRGEPAGVVERALPVPPPPGSPAEHFAADLTFRYLPAVLRRARAIDATDPLSTRLAEVLRGWPLSGALADLDEGPTAPVDFGGHDGLMLRFAERIAERPRDSWMPAEGRGRDWLRLAFDAIGRPSPIAPDPGASRGPT